MLLQVIVLDKMMINNNKWGRKNKIWQYETGQYL